MKWFKEELKFLFDTENMISIQLRKEEENTMQVLYKSTRGNGEEFKQHPRQF